MDAITLVSLIFGIFGLVAFGKVNKLSKQVYLLRSDLKVAVTAKEQHGGGGGSCGCGGNC